MDWEAMDAHAPSTDDREVLDAFWSSVARGWLDALRGNLGSRYRVQESDRSLLLSSLEASRAEGVLDYVETTRKRILSLLDGIRRTASSARCACWSSPPFDRYCEYVSHYYLPEGEFAQSGGMFIQEGYGPSSSWPTT